MRPGAFGSIVADHDAAPEFQASCNALRREAGVTDANAGSFRK